MRRITWKHVAIVVVTALAVYLIAGIVLAGRGTSNLPETSQSIDLRGGKVQGHRYTTKSWSFDYQTAHLSPDGTTGEVDGVRNGVVFRKGKPYLRISAQRITMNVQSLDFTAIGKVHVERIDDPEKRSFDTDLVIWTNGAKLLRMDHPSYLHTGSETLKLQNVVVNFDTEQITFGKMGGSFEMPGK